MQIKKWLTKYKKIFYRNSNISIDYENVIELYNEGKAIIVDVRNLEEFEEEHVKGAINIPVYDIENNISELGKNKDMTIVVYCTTGKRSKMARDILIKQGFKNVYILYI